MMKKMLGILLLCAGVSTAKAATIDTLIVGTAAEYDTLNPVIVSQAAANYMLYVAWRPWVYLDKNDKWASDLFKKVPMVENGLAKRKGTGVVANVEILEKAVWGDGTPVTCRDLEFSHRVVTNTNVSIPAREPFENISSIKWDPKTPKKCVIEMKLPKFDFFWNLPDPLPAHIEEPIFEKHKGTPEGYDRNSAYVKDPTNPGLWYGPYRLSEAKLGSHVIFVPNPKYHGKQGSFKKIIFKLIPNTSTMEANLRSGVINFIAPPGGLSLDQASELSRKVKSENLPFEVRFEDGLVYSHIDLNMANPILADIKVRRAFAQAINKKEIINKMLEGRAKEAIHNVSSSDAWYTDKVQVYPYNKREAGRLLDEAGWKMGPDGVRMKDGKKMSLTIMAVGGVKLNEMIEAYIQDQFKQLGVELLIKNEPARVFFGDTTTHRKFDMAFFAWGSAPESSPRSTLHTTMIPSDKNSWSGQNYTGYSNPEVDKLIDQLEQELDAKKRIKIAHKILEHYAKDVPVISMYFRQDNAVIPAGLKGYHLAGHKFYETLDVESWHF